MLIYLKNDFDLNIPKTYLIKIDIDIQKSIPNRIFLNIKNQNIHNRKKHIVFLPYL